MKKNIIPLLAVTALTLTSCERTIYDVFDAVEPQLLLHAQMNVEDSEHFVYLGLSAQNGLTELDEGSVRCFVNGELVAEGIESPKEEVEDEKYGTYDIEDQNMDIYMLPKSASEAKQKRFAIKASFKAGDAVRIEAEGKASGQAFEAWSEVTVPKAPAIQISSIDDDGGYGASFKMRIRGTDVKGESSYYRLNVRMSGDVVMKLNDRVTYEEYEKSGTITPQYVDIEHDNDPILLDGAAASDDLDYYDTSENAFMTFSDNLFADGDFSVSFTTHNRDDNLNYVEDFLYCKEFDLRRVVEVIVTGISREEYNYLKSIAMYSATEGDTMFIEPVSITDNVENGYGLVSICNPAIAETEVSFHGNLQYTY